MPEGSYIPGMDSASVKPPAPVHRYEEIAGRIGYLIESGTFKPGQRIPSVRALGRQMGVSVNTVMQAYALLEDGRVIEARPQSGYYVRGRLPEIPVLPGRMPKRPAPSEVSVSAICQKMMRDTMDPSLVQLGGAIPNPDLLPGERLGRMIASEVRRFGNRSVAYATPPGLEKLRRQVAGRALESGCVLGPDEIVITSGCVEAVYFALRACCRPGDTVAVESPTYYNFLQLLQELGLKVLEIPSSPATGMSIEALRYALDHAPVRACLAITNFSNPLGGLMPEENKRELVAMLAERDVALVEDDIYGDLSFSPTRPHVAKKFDRKGLVLLCSSYSKTLAPGYRVGWVAAGRFQPEVERLKLILNLATASPTQMAVAEFLANGGYDHHLRGLRKAYARQTALMAEAVGNSFPETTRVTRPAGGFVLWVEMPGGVDAIRLYGAAREAGISIAPGPIFSADGKFPNSIRLNAAFWSPEVERAIATLGEIAERLLREADGGGPRGEDGNRKPSAVPFIQKP
jgi:DNA-binding transcriptional MocR family regulator